MSWMHDIFNKLKQEPEWHLAGALYAEVRNRIPLNVAVKNYESKQRCKATPANTEQVLFRYLAASLFSMGIEKSTHRLTPATMIRLKPRSCSKCGNVYLPMKRAGVICKNCKK